jgi:hypothetical protein
MNDATEVIWRKALQAKGKDWVLNHLRRRPGQPGDTVYDVVFEAPFPTRAFCQRWCADEDNKIFNVSGHAIVLLIAFVIVVICTLRAVHSWDALTVQQALDVPISGGGMSTGTGTASDADSAASSDPSTNVNSLSGGTGSSDSDSLPSVCAYITYDTTRCHVQH